MATWEQWLPELQLSAVGAPIPLIHLCLNRAARSFLRQTRAWQEWLEPVDVTGERLKEYSFELPQGAELVRLERATLDGRPLTIANARDMEADPWRHPATGSAYLVSTDLSTFNVVVNAGGAVQVYVSLMPTMRGTSVPDVIASRYHEAIREGAKAELLNTRGTDYYAPDQAAVSLAYFNQACASGVTDVWRSETSRTSRGRVRWL